VRPGVAAFTVLPGYFQDYTTASNNGDYFEMGQVTALIVN